MAITLCSLHNDALYSILSYFDILSIGTTESTCRTLFHAANRENIWRNICQRLFANVLLPRSSFHGKALVQYFTEHKKDHAELLDASLGCSSIDRPEECPKKTLVQSFCVRQLSMPKLSCLARTISQVFRGYSSEISFQRCCGCALGVSCYWSSAPSLDDNVINYLDYGFSSECSVVTSLIVTPYQAHWHPSAPTYSPKKVSCSFGFVDPETNVFQPYYESPVFEAKKKDTEYILPKPALFRGGVCRVFLIGHQQEQTIDISSNGTHKKLFYTCISYVACMGTHVNPLPLQKIVADITCKG